MAGVALMSMTGLLAEPSSRVTLFLAGDVMTGRGIDQILAHPGDPTLYERWVRNAEGYVALAERVNGPIPRRAPPDYIWGDAIAELELLGPDVRIVNLETAVTHRGEPWPGKGIHYRMHPANVATLTVAGIDAVTLANNHVLDWSREGFEQTLDALSAAGIGTAGAGRDAARATAPALIPAGAVRVVVVGLGAASSGIPLSWEARGDRPGVALLHDLSDREVDMVAERIAAVSGPADIVVVSIHWGGNWGYGVPRAHRSFAHRLVERAGVHIVHGHSSHHPLGIEVHRGRPIIYGCGDLITDYEGIGGHEAFRPHLGLMYLVTMDSVAGIVERLVLIPTRLRRFRLERANREETRWLARVLGREGSPLGTTVDVTSEGRLVVGW